MGMKYNLSVLGIVVRLAAAMSWALLSAYTENFVFYIVAVITLVMSLTGYDPVLDYIQMRKKSKA